MNSDEDPPLRPDSPEALTSKSLAQLSDWVQDVLTPYYLREPSTTSLWCGYWYTHPEAVARLWALYLAWRHLIHELDDDEDPLVGAIAWQLEHLDKTLEQLRSPTGPFASCSSSPDRDDHHLLQPPICHPIPENYQLDLNPD